MSLLLAMRLVRLVFGAVLMTGGVMVRYRPALLSAENGSVLVNFVTPAFAFPVWGLWLAALALLAAWLTASHSGRQTLRRLSRDPGRRIRVFAAAALLLVTLLPLSYSRGAAADDRVIVYLLLAGLGTIGLLAGLGPILDLPARGLFRIWALLRGLKPAPFITGLALLVLAASVLISWLVFGGIPRIHDNVAQLFQARLFTQGRLLAISPPLPQFFDLMMMVNDGHWYSQYPPGHPLMLMFGVLLDAPWLVNPLLGALTVVAVYLLGRAVADESTARIAALLGGFSPFLVLVSAQFLNHATSLFFTALFLLCYLRATGAERIRPGPALLAGLSLGMVLLTRPYTALLVAVPFAVDGAVRILRRRAFAGYALMLLGFGLMLGLLMLYNQLTSGNPFELGYVRRYGPGHGLGFGRSGWGTAAYTVAQALRATSLDLNALNRWLLEFPIPALVFVALLIAAQRLRRVDLLLFGVFASLIIGHFFYWWHDLLFGPRWEYEALPALLPLAARGLRAWPDYAARELNLAPDPETARVRLARLLVLCGLSLFAVAYPSLIRQLPSSFGIRTETARAVGRGVKAPALVFTPHLGDVFLRNGIPPGGDVVYANELGALDPLLSLRFPGRRWYYANRDTLRELPAREFPASELKAGLDSTVAELSRRDLRVYRSIFWPADELIPMVEPVARRNGLPVASYRTIDRISIDRRNPQQISFPALAAWVIGDLSEHVALFLPMNEGRSYTSSGLRITLIGTTPNGLVALYDIRPGR